MPDFEKRIAEWRRQLAAGGVKAPAVLDELESHLREEIRARLSDGASESKAFETAVAGIGTPGSLRTEFNKISGATCLPVVIGASVWTGTAILMAVLLSRKVFGGKMGLLLFTHIVTLTSGYLAAFLAGSFAIVYLCWRWSGRLSPAREQSLGRAVLWFSYISGGLIIGGFLLGMLWGRQHLGAYLEGSPRGIGCLCACAWAVALCLVQGFGKMSDHVRMLLSIVGNVIVGLTWFCAVVPGMGLNAIAAYWPVEVFLGVHVLFLLMGFSRRFETAKS